MKKAIILGLCLVPCIYSSASYFEEDSNQGRSARELLQRNRKYVKNADLLEKLMSILEMRKSIIEDSEAILRLQDERARIKEDSAGAIEGEAVQKRIENADPTDPEAGWSILDHSAVLLQGRPGLLNKLIEAYVVSDEDKALFKHYYEQALKESQGKSDTDSIEKLRKNKKESN